MNIMQQTSRQMNFWQRCLLNRLIRKRYFFFPPTIFLSLFLAPLTAYAALSAVTTQTIEGQAPYLTFDKGVTKAENASPLLTLKLSDGRTCTPTNNQCTQATPIELPVAGQTLNDVQMPVPTTANTIALKTLIGGNHYWRDDNGDGEETNGLTVTGNLTANFMDSDYNRIVRGEKLTLCHSPYRIMLASSSGQLSTQYGVPNSSNFTGSTITYYVNPKNIPAGCYAYPSNNKSNLVESSQWVSNYGFIPQNIDNPASNFPTTGGNNFYFNLTVAGSLGNVSYEKSPGNSGLSLEVTSSNTTPAKPAFKNLKITLRGPDDTTKNTASTAMPTTFTLYSNLGTTKTKLYSFTISKWFITKYGYYHTFQANYCTATYGGNYRIPKVREYTNAKAQGGEFSDAELWADGEGNVDMYKRKIGGGLFSEWGDLGNKGDYPNVSFNNDIGYWAIDIAPKNGYRHAVASNNGSINMAYMPSQHEAHFSCVTP